MGVNNNQSPKIQTDRPWDEARQGEIKAKNSKGKREKCWEKEYLLALFTPQPIFCKSIYVQIICILHAHRTRTHEKKQISPKREDNMEGKHACEYLFYDFFPLEMEMNSEYSTCILSI